VFNINKILVEWIKNLIWIYKFCFIVFFYCFFSVHDLPGLTWRNQGWPGGTSVDLEGLRLIWRTWVDMEGPVLTWRDQGWPGGPGLTWRDQGWPGGTRVDLEGPVLTWRDSGWHGGTRVDLNEGLLNELVVVCMLLVFHFQKFKMFWCCMCIMSDLWLMLTAKVDWVERSSEHASSHEEYLESWLPAALGAV